VAQRFVRMVGGFVNRIRENGAERQTLTLLAYIYVLQPAMLSDNSVLTWLSVALRYWVKEIGNEFVCTCVLRSQIRVRKQEARKPINKRSEAKQSKAKTRHQSSPS
jgi:hypothetical protein